MSKNDNRMRSNAFLTDKFYRHFVGECVYVNRIAHNNLILNMARIIKIPSAKKKILEMTINFFIILKKSENHVNFSFINDDIFFNQY